MESTQVLVTAEKAEQNRDAYVPIPLVPRCEDPAPSSDWLRWEAAATFRSGR